MAKKMIRHINSTKRKKILTRNVKIELSLDPSPSISIPTLNLAEYDFPQDAKLMLDVFASGYNGMEQIELGTVGAPITTSPLPESIWERVDSVQFMLKVVDRSDEYGLLLGTTTKLKTIGSGGGSELALMASPDLGDRPWKLEFSEKDVALLYNSDLPNVKGRGSLICLFLPDIVRQILYRAALDRDEPEWAPRWLAWGKLYHKDQIGLIDDDTDRENLSWEEVEEWVEDVIQKFCEEFSFKKKFVDLFKTSKSDEGDGE